MRIILDGGRYGLINQLSNTDRIGGTTKPAATHFIASPNRYLVHCQLRRFSPAVSLRTI